MQWLHKEKKEKKKGKRKRRRDEALELELLARPHHGRNPLALLPESVALLGDDLSRLVFRERRLRETTLALGSLSAPDAAAGNTRADGLLLGLPALLRGLPTRN